MKKRKPKKCRYILFTILHSCRSSYTYLHFPLYNTVLPRNNTLFEHSLVICFVKMYMKLSQCEIIVKITLKPSNDEWTVEYLSLENEKHLTMVMTLGGRFRSGGADEA